MPEHKTEKTVRYDIFIAGDYCKAKDICREYCLEIGFCVTVERVDYIHTGGEESGVRIGLLNYPRFPDTDSNIRNKAMLLAEKLRDGLFQHSFTLCGPDLTEYYSRR